jgi:centrosomal protein POC5
MFFGLRPGPDMNEAFQRWRAHLLEKKRRRAAALAATAHSNRTLLLAVLRDWRSNARASFRERMHAELDARWAEGAQSEAAKFGVLLARLQSELEDARAALERETGARVEAEERFKQAFMRGVCALNFEALNVLKNGPLVDALKGRAPSSNTHA